MRIFLALKIKDELAGRIEADTKGLRGIIPARWVEKNNLHVTLVPPWEAKETALAVSALKNFISPVSPLSLSFYKIDYGPDRKRPRLIWAVGGENVSLTSLAEKLHRLLHIVPKSDFLPHMTLARFRENDFKAFSAKRLNIPIDWSFVSSSFFLLESMQNEEGTYYRVIQEFPFRRD